jgi:hypothetical protein
MRVSVEIRGHGRLKVRVVEYTNDLALVFPQGLPALPAAAMISSEDDYYNRSVLVTRVYVVE